MFPVGSVVFGNCRYQDIDSVAKIIAVKFGGIIVLSAVIDQVLLAEVFGFLFLIDFFKISNTVFCDNEKNFKLRLVTELFLRLDLRR